MSGLNYWACGVVLDDRGVGESVERETRVFMTPGEDQQSSMGI